MEWLDQHWRMLKLRLARNGIDHRIHQLADTDVTFVLTSGGHNAGIVSEPGRPRRRYRIALRAADGPCLGPDEWMLHLPPGQVGAVSASCAALMGSHPHSLVDVSGREVTLEIDGPRAAELLTLGCARDVEAIFASTWIFVGSVAEVQLGARQNGLRVDSAYADLKQRDAELVAHADFRKHLYAYDVVPAAKAVAAALA